MPAQRRAGWARTGRAGRHPGQASRVERGYARMKLTRSRGRGWWKEWTTPRGWRVPVIPLMRR